MANLVLISINSPLLAGLYEDNKLIKQCEMQGHTSAALNNLFNEIFTHNITLDCIFYAKGPGRYSALKSTHIFLHTLSVTMGYRLFSVESFYFNNNAPIHAFGENYFVYESGEITLKCANDIKHTALAQGFSLPIELKLQDFGVENTPLYILPAV